MSDEDQKGMTPALDYSNFQAQEYLRKITTVAIDMEAAWEAVLKMYQVNLDGRGVGELESILLWITRATKSLYLSDVAEWLKRSSASEDTAVACRERIHTRYGILLKVVKVDGGSTVELAHPAMAEYIREYLAKYPSSPFPPSTRGAKLGANIAVLKPGPLE